MNRAGKQESSDLSVTISNPPLGWQCGLLFISSKGEIPIACFVVSLGGEVSCFSDSAGSGSFGSGDQDEAYLRRLVLGLKQKREERGMTLRDLEKVMGVSNGHLSRAERGLSEPGVVVLRRWCRALGLIFEEVCRSAEQGIAIPDLEALHRNRLKTSQILQKDRKDRSFRQWERSIQEKERPLRDKDRRMVSEERSVQK